MTVNGTLPPSFVCRHKHCFRLGLRDRQAERGTYMHAVTITVIILSSLGRWVIAVQCPYRQHTAFISHDVWAFFSFLPCPSACPAGPFPLFVFPLSFFRWSCTMLLRSPIRMSLRVRVRVRTAIPFWGQTTIKKRDCGSRGVNSALQQLTVACRPPATLSCRVAALYSRLSSIVYLA